MENSAESFVNLIIDKTVGMVVSISNNNDIKYDKDKAIKFLSENMPEFSKKAYMEMKKAGKEADIFDGMDIGVLHSLPKKSAIVELNYQCMEFAKEILNNSKIED